MITSETVLEVMVLLLILLGYLIYDETRRTDWTRFPHPDSDVERQMNQIREECEDFERKVRKRQAEERKRLTLPEFTLLRASEDNFDATLLRSVKIRQAEDTDTLLRNTDDV